MTITWRTSVRSNAGYNHADVSMFTDVTRLRFNELLEELNGRSIQQHVFERHSWVGILF